jgi:hypothetical protein
MTSWGRFGSSKWTSRYPTDVSDSPLLTTTCVQNTHDLKLHELSVWSAWVLNRSADYNGFAAVTHVNYILCSFFKFIVLVHMYMIFDERDYRFVVKLTVLFQLDVWLVLVCLQVSVYFADSKHSSLEVYALISETSLLAFSQIFVSWNPVCGWNIGSQNDQHMTEGLKDLSSCMSSGDREAENCAMILQGTCSLSWSLCCNSCWGRHA